MIESSFKIPGVFTLTFSEAINAEEYASCEAEAKSVRAFLLALDANSGKNDNK